MWRLQGRFTVFVDFILHIHRKSNVYIMLDIFLTADGIFSDFFVNIDGPSGSTKNYYSATTSPTFSFYIDLILCLFGKKLGQRLINYSLMLRHEPLIQSRGSVLTIKMGTFSMFSTVRQHNDTCEETLLRCVILADDLIIQE